MRMTRSLGALLLLVSMLAPSAVRAQSYEERLVRIPISVPDEDGRLITLDAGVAIPTSGQPPFPAIVLNHGLMGSRTGDTALVRQATERGYIVLRYSARGHGDTPGKIDLMGYREQQDLLDAINWLNDPENVPEIWVDHIAQLGGSYGGQHGMMLATMNHPAIKAVAPLAAFTDFYRGLAPYDVPKALIIGISYLGGLALPEPQDRWSEDMHRIVHALTTGVGLEDAKQRLQARSTIHRLDNIRVPMFFAQGWNDSFFAAEEFIEAFNHLRARGVPAYLYVGGIGHPPAVGNVGGPEALHIGQKLWAWFDKYVKGIDNGVDLLPPIEFSNASWDGPGWDGTSMTAWSWPVGVPSAWHLCPGAPGAEGVLASEPCGEAPPVVLHNTYAAANPAGEPISAQFFRDNGFDLSQIPSTATPLDTATFVSAPLTEGRQMTGTPHFDLDVLSVSPGAPLGPGPVQTMQVDPRIYDVAPDGSEILVTRGAYSEGPGAPLGPHRAIFDAFGFSYRFEAGHRIKVVLATNDAPFLKPAANPFTIFIGSASTVELPGSEFIIP